MLLSSLVAAVRRTFRPAWPGWLWRASWRIALGLLVAVWTTLVLVWLAVHWLILPRLDEWRPMIEAQAGRAIGHPVQIGQIAVHSSGWVPSFVLRDVVVRDAHGRDALRLPLVSAALSVPSLLGLSLRFEQLLIEDARLEVRRDLQGHWHVAGLDLASADTALDASAAADWFFEQHEVVVRGGLLRWVDEQRAAPPLQLADVLLVVRNQGRRHEFRLDATPPADWGERLSLRAQVRGPLLARAGDWQHWKGTLYADLPRVDVNGLRRHVNLPVDLQQGEAALRAWVDWDQGLPQALTLDAALRQVSVQLADDLAPLAFAELGGRFVVERESSGVKLAVDRLSFTTADGQTWTPSQFALQWRQVQPMKLDQVGVGHPVTGGELKADRLDLASLADLAEHLPIGGGLRSLLLQLNPEGRVQALQARWDGPLDAPEHYSVRAKVQGLAIAAAPSPEPGGIGRPGWRGADLDLSASETGGRADLSLSNGVIELPGVFEQAIVPLTHFSSQLSWRIQPAQAAVATARGALPASQAAPRIELKLLNARFDNDDARGALNATWHSGAGSGFGKGGRLPGQLELSGTLSEGRANRVARYLPLGIGEQTRSWVQRAVKGGELRRLSYRVKGDLWDFPYVNRRDGEFRIAGWVQDLTLAPVPSVLAGGQQAAWETPWPAFSDVSGELVFERSAMQFQQARGRLWGLELTDVQGRIRELSDHALLEVEGQARGPLPDLLRYLNTTPLGAWTGDALAQASASGSAELRLGLNIPLARPADSQVKAVLQLAGNDLSLWPGLPLLPNARGRVEATQKSLQLTGLRTQLVGGEAQIDGGSQADGSLRFSINGTASAEGLRRTTELGAAARWAQRLQGQTAYRALVGLQHGRTEWQLSSTLAGMAIDLPAPLGKPADGRVALRLGSTWQDDPRGGVPRDWLRLELGLLQASALLDHGSTRVLRSALAYDSVLPEPVAGGRALLTLPRLDLDVWRTLAWPGDSAVAFDPVSWLPSSVQLKTPELRIGGRTLSGVTLDLQRLGAPGDAGWRVQGTSDQTAGSVEYREPRSVGAAGLVKARLSRLALPPADADKVSDSVASLLEHAPSTVPALDIEIDDFELRGHKLGSLAVEAVNRAPGGAGEWRLNRLQLGNADARLAASGRWQAGAVGAPRHMALDFKLDIDDGGALLQRLGLGLALKGGKGQIKGVLGWDGSPLAPDLPSLGGKLALTIDNGQFLKVDTGAARLLGVFSLQALPRRLLLDFRDVFQEGLAFDKITADLRISQGVASTDNLRLRSLQAVVLVEGSADIDRETQSLHVLALPELNTASASLAYAAVNPAVALGAFVGQWLLREPLRQLSAREFRISGGWDAPLVERVERKLMEPLPAVANAAASAAARP